MDNDSTYNAIMGHDFLMAVSIDVLHSSQESKWMDIWLPFRRRDSIDDPLDLHTACLEVLAADVDELELFSNMEAKYDAIDPREVANAQQHLTPSQCQDLGDLLCKFPKLFDGTLRSAVRIKVPRYT